MPEWRQELIQDIESQQAAMECQTTKAFIQGSAHAQLEKTVTVTQNHSSLILKGFFSSQLLASHFESMNFHVFLRSRNWPRLSLAIPICLPWTVWVLSTHLLPQVLQQRNVPVSNPSGRCLQRRLFSPGLRSSVARECFDHRRVWWHWRTTVSQLNNMTSGSETQAHLFSNHLKYFTLLKRKMSLAPSSHSKSSKCDQCRLSQS